MSEKGVWQSSNPNPYAKAVGVPGIAPTITLRVHARILPGSPVGELGNPIASRPRIRANTRAYLGPKQDRVHAPNDGIS